MNYVEAVRNMIVAWLTKHKPSPLEELEAECTMTTTGDPEASYHIQGNITLEEK